MFNKLFIFILILFFVFNFVFLKVEGKEKDNSVLNFEKSLYEIGRLLSIEKISNGGRDKILKIKNSILSNGKEKLLIFMYHGFYDDQNDLKTKYFISKSEFEEHLKILREFNFKPVNMIDIYYFIKFKKKIPERAVYLTFDDGFKNFMKVYELIKKYEFKGGISIITGFVNDRWTLDLDEISKLKEEGYIDIISHSHKIHNLFKKLVKNKDYETIKNDIKKSKEFLNLYNLDTFAFAYPLSIGSNDLNIHKILSELGFKMAFDGFNGYFVKNGINLFNIPRIEVSTRNGLNKKENFRNLIFNIVNNSN
ncbi:MAG: polysaccharide deacetylase family protein [Caldisericia bacterium]|nr:polysaccharide deacetylase family protein [Caldisericia bacterium]